MGGIILEIWLVILNNNIVILKLTIGSTKVFANMKELAYRIDLDAKANTNHTHDDRYYTKSQVDDKISSSSGPKIVWSATCNETTNDDSYTTIASNISSNCDYIIFTSNLINNMEVPQVTIVRGQIVAFPSSYRNNLYYVDVEFRGSSLIADPTINFNVITGSLIGYSQ